MPYALATHMDSGKIDRYRKTVCASIRFIHCVNFDLDDGLSNTSRNTTILATWALENWPNGLWKAKQWSCSSYRQLFIGIKLAKTCSYIFKSLLEIGEAVSLFVTCLFCSLNKL